MINIKIVRQEVIKSKQRIDLKKDGKERGIWQFSSYLLPIDPKYKLTLEEGDTNLEAFRDLFLKREDKNPTGSLKDRGMAYQISQIYSEGKKNLVISSSGNAAISAAAYCRLAGFKLYAFISPKTNRGKLEKLQKLGAEIIVSSKAVSQAARFAKEKNYVNLRPSISEFGPEGYQTIAYELMKENFEDIFIPVSSGTALTGIARGFLKFGFLPRIHLCQSAAVCPLGSLFDKDFIKENFSPAKALVAKFSPLKKEIVKYIKDSGGSGWVIESEEVIKIDKDLQKNNIETSEEGALALAAVYKAREKGFNLGKTVVLLTGKKY